MNEHPRKVTPASYEHLVTYAPTLNLRFVRRINSRGESHSILQQMMHRRDPVGVETFIWRDVPIDDDTGHANKDRRIEELSNLLNECHQFIVGKNQWEEFMKVVTAEDQC